MHLKLVLTFGIFYLYIIFIANLKKVGNIDKPADLRLVPLPPRAGDLLEGRRRPLIIIGFTKEAQNIY